MGVVGVLGTQFGASLASSLHPWQRVEVFLCSLKGKINLHVKEWKRAGDGSSPTTFPLYSLLPPCFPFGIPLQLTNYRRIKASSHRGRDPGVSSPSASPLLRRAELPTQSCSVPAHPSPPHAVTLEAARGGGEGTAWGERV